MQLPQLTVEERITIAAPATVVYAAISDIRRMGEWSPECVGGTLSPPGAEPVVGARFLGHNRNSRGHTWTTRCTVTIAEPPQCFSFDVSLYGRVASWRFDLVEVSGGTHCEVIQSWRDRRGPTRRRLSALISGVRDRAAHNRDTMRVTLRRLKQALERSSQ